MAPNSVLMENKDKLDKFKLKHCFVRPGSQLESQVAFEFDKIRIPEFRDKIVTVASLMKDKQLSEILWNLMPLLNYRDS